MRGLRSDLESWCLKQEEQRCDSETLQQKTSDMIDEKMLRAVVIAATTLALFGCAGSSPHVQKLSQQADSTGAQTVADMPDTSEVAPTPADEAHYPDDDYALSPYWRDQVDPKSVIGTGRFLYTFILIDQLTGEPAANRPFALSNSEIDLPFATGSKKVYQGVTDAEGKTPVFATETRSKNGWLFRERIGAGPNGAQFRLVGQQSDTPLRREQYTLVLCSNPPKRLMGYSDDKGYTAYAASAQPDIDVQIFKGLQPKAKCKIAAPAKTSRR